MDWALFLFCVLMALKFLRDWSWSCFGSCYILLVLKHSFLLSVLGAGLLFGSFETSSCIGTWGNGLGRIILGLEKPVLVWSGKLSSFLVFVRVVVWIFMAWSLFWASVLSCPSHDLDLDGLVYVSEHTSFVLGVHHGCYVPEQGQIWAFLVFHWIWI